MNLFVDYQKLLIMINNSYLVYNLKQCKEEIYQDQELITMIKKYHLTNDKTIRKKIYNNNKFINYKKKENELNLMIMKLNTIFKELKKDL